MGRRIELKNRMNNNRTNFTFPDSHNITISRSWLLGLIEGEGSFYLERDRFRPVFQLSLTEIQLPVIEKIKEYLESNLGFDEYSMFKLKHSSVISIGTDNARKNSKTMKKLVIKNINILVNYFIPFFDNITFITKKGQDFKDFKIISTAIYNGVHRVDNIKSLILKLSYTMNNYRLSSNLEPVLYLSDEEFNTIIKANSTIIFLKDGRQIDVITRKEVNRRWINCVYEIINDSGEISLASTLDNAAEILDVTYRTLAKHLDREDLNVGDFVEIKGKKVRRVPVFYN